MPTFRRGTVTAILEQRPDLVRVRVALTDGDIDAAGFPAMLGPLTVNDEVVVNTTGIELELGTGGIGFILWNVDGPGPDAPSVGHIMKMRYTPWQTDVLAAEAPESPHHDELRNRDSIDGMPVVACSLHSQVAAVAAGIKAERPDLKVGYLMTDAAALPLAWSNLVRSLVDKGLIDVTCTTGHAFGGDLESVNVFSGLITLRWAAGCDVAIVGMGPGVVGTGTALGFTAMEQGQILDAAASLGGKAFACLRLSFADERARHQGVSHHSSTALRVAAIRRSVVVVPELEDGQAAGVTEQLDRSGVAAAHDVVVVDGGPGLELLERAGIRPTSMGRSIDEVPELFLAASAAGRAAAGVAPPAP